MCGRYEIESNSSKQVKDDFNIAFKFDENSNIGSSMLLPTIIKTERGLKQFNGAWGIKPSCSKKLLINAQSEAASA